MPPTATIDTERLTLCAPVEADAQVIFERYSQDPLVARYMSWTPHSSTDETLEFVRARLFAMEEGKLQMWLIRERNQGRLLGSIGIGHAGHRADVGYCMARDSWNLGYATEAVIAAVDFALVESCIWRIAALCDVENLASIRVLEKAGFQFEGTLRRYYKFPNFGDTPRDVHSYSKIIDR